VEFNKLRNLVSPCVSPYDSMCKIKRFMKLKFIVYLEYLLMTACVKLSIL